MLRARISILSEAAIELGEFRKENTTYKIRNAADFFKDNVSENYRVVDIIFPSVGSMSDSFTHSLDLIDTFLDCASYIGYSTADLHEYYSLCPMETVPGKIFEMLVPQYMLRKQHNPVTLNAIQQVGITKQNKNLLRLLRNALNSNSSEERYLALYSALEFLAEQYSDEYIFYRCDSCGYEKNTGRKATGNYLKTIFGNYGKDAKEVERYKSLRAKIAHGSGTRNQDYLATVTEYASYLEEILVQEIDKLVNIPKANSGNVIVSSQPFFIHECQQDTDGSFILLNSRWKAPIKFTNIQSREQKSTMSVGAPLGPDQRPIIDPISWPNLMN